MELSLFNCKDGYPEAVVRGFKQALLSPEDYRRLGLAETLEDLRTALEDTDYAQFLQDEPTPLAVTTIATKCREKMASEFSYLRAQAGQPLVQFFDFIISERMIDNIVGLIQGAANNKPAEELLGRIDPLGWFPGMKAIVSMDLSAGYDDLYRSLLIDTPVGPYFERFLVEIAAEQHEQARTMADVGHMLTDIDLEILRNTLKKAWLEDFYSFCQNVGGTTHDVMGHILKCEADFRVLLVTLNTLNSAAGQGGQQQDRNSLYPSFGYLYPEGTDRIRKAWNDITLRQALEPYAMYLSFYEQCKHFYIREGDEGAEAAAAQLENKGVRSLEDLLYAEEVKMCELAFEQQMHYGVFYAWIKLKEQEIRNIVWIADMVSMRRKEHVDAILPLFLPRF